MNKILWFLTFIIVTILLISLYFNYKNQLSIYEKNLIIQKIEKEIDNKNKEIVSINKQLDIANEKLKSDIFKKNQECSKYLEKMKNNVWMQNSLFITYEEEIFYSSTSNTCIYWLMELNIQSPPIPDNMVYFRIKLVDVFSSKEYLWNVYLSNTNFKPVIEENNLVINYRKLVKNMKWE